MVQKHLTSYTLGCELKFEILARFSIGEDGCHQNNGQADV